MSINPKVEEVIAWYVKRQPAYEALAKKVESIIREILEAAGINYYSISCRAKPVDSFREKASREKYKDPCSEIMDMAGIRVITYTDSDAKGVLEIIQEAFEILPQHTIDKSAELGTNRVGYRSIHCVGTLGKKRLRLPEYKLFTEMCFEVQIRTILQHAWAEFEHDRNYKFSGVLPKDMRRRLSIVAGNLELIDREFDSISKAIDAYVVEVNRKTEIGDLSVPIDSKSLIAYMNKKFQPLVGLGVIQDFGGSDSVIIRFLSAMNINTLEELDNIVPKDYVEKLTQHLQLPMSFFGIIFQLLAIHDADMLLNSWKEELHADGMLVYPRVLSLFKEYGVDLEERARKHAIKLKRQVEEVRK